MTIEAVREIVAAVLIVLGAIVVFSAALGLVRFPDAYTRMHAATKAGVVGAGSLMLGAALAVGSWGAFLVACAGVFFLVTTVTIAAHTLGRAAYLSGSPLTQNTVTDALQGVYEDDVAAVDSPGTAGTTGADPLRAGRE